MLFDTHAIDPKAQLLDLDRTDCEESLYVFLKSAWNIFDSAPFVDGWVIDAICEHLQAVIDGQIRRLIINIPPRCLKSSLCSITLPGWTWAQRVRSHTSGPGVSFLYASFREDLSRRDSVQSRRVIESKWYQDRWGDRFALSDDQNTKSRFNNDQGGYRLITSVESKGATGDGANIIVLDDVNSAKEVESEAVVASTLEWFDGTLGTRFNNQKLGAVINIQQRLGENDITGHILSKSTNDWTLLCLPMEYEPDRSFTTSIGWTDPRSEPGELLWPERFGPDEVKGLKTWMGEWRCTPAESPILMSDLSMKPIGEIAVGDQIVGFEIPPTPEGCAFARQRLVKTTVSEVHKYFAPVVKITLDSGAVIRCTPDHKWFMRQRNDGRDCYSPATLRSSLSRVCPAHLPILNEADARDAGWLSGFFDGEGSVSLMKRPNYEPATKIVFYQGAGRNKPLCDKLERLLAHFGFDWLCEEDLRKPNQNTPCYPFRVYRLTNHSRMTLPVHQRFLHIVQPTKWRDRIIDGVYKSNFIQGRERVVRIEPDGEETVYGLTTGTGNYVIWGLVSSNSAGQLQQRPEPRGGGIIKRDWWQLWERDTYPPMDFILATLDTAYTLEKMNDPSGLIVWGVFSGDASAQATRRLDANGRMVFVDRLYSEEAPKVMLAHAWTDRYEFHELIKKTAKTCIDMKVDLLLIENKAAGISVAQELRRLYSNEKFSVQLFDPKSQDKFARLVSVQHLFQEGLIYAPDRVWADAVITQVGQFPRGKHDEYVDLTSMGLRYLRDRGLISRATERRAELDSFKIYPRNQNAPLYPV